MQSQPENLERPRSNDLDRILGLAIPVLDDGFVRVVDYMGSDESIVQSARVSYGAGTKMVHEDNALVRYLLRHGHTTPFEMCEIKLHVRVPMDCWRQWIRHRTANVNEYSTRYSVAIDAAQRTTPEQWRAQGTLNRQGSGGFIDKSIGEHLTDRERELQDFSRVIYNERLARGVAREQARKDLPLSTYTEAYWKIDLHNLLHFLRLRMDAHAQLEIRQYALAIGNEIVAKWCPVAWQAFLDYRVNSMSFSRLESALLSAIVNGNELRVLELAVEAGWIETGGRLKRSRERQEFEAKLKELDLTAPWVPPPENVGR